MGCGAIGNEREDAMQIPRFALRDDKKIIERESRARDSRGNREVSQMPVRCAGNDKMRGNGCSERRQQQDANTILSKT